jgi:hypothetical protein
MHTLTVLARWEGFILFGGLFGIVFWKTLTGNISLSYLLDGDIRDANSSDGSGFSTFPSAGRAQSVMFTMFVALYYLLQVIHNPTEFPKLPDAMVGVLAGSQAVYLGGKAQAIFLGRLRDLLK